MWAAVGCWCEGTHWGVRGLWGRIWGWGGPAVGCTAGSRVPGGSGGCGGGLGGGGCEGQRLCRGRGRCRGRRSVSRCCRVSRCRSAPPGAPGAAPPSRPPGAERAGNAAAASGKVLKLILAAFYSVLVVFICYSCALSLLCGEVCSLCFFPAPPRREPFRAVGLRVVVETSGWWWSFGSRGMVIFLNQK